MPLLPGVRAEPLRPLEPDWTMPSRGRVTASFQPEPVTEVSNARFDIVPGPDFVRDHGRVNRPNAPNSQSRWVFLQQYAERCSHLSAESCSLSSS